MPTFRAASSAGAQTGTTIAVTKPTGVVTGDLMVAVMGNAGSSTAATLAGLTAPAGWTAVDGGTANASYGNLRAYWKIATASEGTSYTFGVNGLGFTVGIVAFVNGTFDPSTPIGDIGASIFTTQTTAKVSPSIIGVTGGTLITAANDIGTAVAPSAETWTPPTGMTERVDVGSAASSPYTGMEISTLDLTADGATGTKTNTSAVNRRGIAASILVNPVASGLSTSFTGTTGAAWPSPWSGVSGTSSIQSNRGQQVTPSTSAWSAAENRANQTVTDTSVLATLNFPTTANNSQRINLRYNPATGNGYRLIMTPSYSGLQLMRVDAYTETPLKEFFDQTWTASTDYKVRFDAVGTTLRVRRWLASTAEPTTWDIMVSDATYASGDICLVTTSGATAAAVTGTWDDVSLSAPDTSTPAYSGSLGLSGSGSLALTNPVVTGGGPALSIVPNQERGFFYYTETHERTDGSGRTPLTQADLATQRAAGTTVVFRYYVLERFLGTDTIDQAFKDFIAADLAAVKAAGLKMVARFTYSTSGVMTPPYNADTTRTRSVGHIQQLAPVLNANADVLDAVQAGFIGMWGEWYYTDNYGDLGNLTAQNWTDRKAILDALLDNLDSRIFVLVRYVGLKRRLLDENPGVTKYADRLGFHNDAFLAASDDWGTYTTFTSYSEAQNRAWLQTDNQTNHHPQLGETANPNSPRSDYASASAEMAAYRWTSLNPSYHATVLASWGQAGRNDASARLGYRLTLGTVTATANANGTVALSIPVTNDGFAAPTRAKPLKVDFVSGGTVYTSDLALDFRNLQPGTTTLAGTVAAPSVAGTYALHLRIVDQSASLQSDARYCVQLANPGVFDSATGRNSLGKSVTTSAAPAFSGSLAVSGSGSLAFSAAQPKVTASAGMAVSGSGTLAFSAAIVRASGSLSLSGSGAQALPAGKLAVNGALTLGGAGTATWTGKPGWVSSLPLGGAGQMDLSNALFGFPGPTMALSGSGTVVFSAARVVIGPVAVPLGGSSTLGTTPTRIVVPRTGSIAVTLAGGGTVVNPPGKPGFTASVALSSGTVQLQRTPLRVASAGSLTFSGVGRLEVNDPNSVPVYVFINNVWRPVKAIRLWNGRSWLNLHSDDFHSYH